MARLLNQAGHRTRNDSKFSDATVDRLLRDPMGKGLRRANYTKSLGDGKAWKLKPESEWVLIKVEPIVSEELWNQCNVILDEMERKYQQQVPQRMARKPVQIFSGIAFCMCGTKMRVPQRTKYICRICHNKIACDDLEAIFQEQLKKFIISPEDVARYLASADQTIKEKDELLRVLIDEQKKVQKAMDRLYDLYMAGEIPKEGFGRKYQPLFDRLKQLEDEVPRLQAEVDALHIHYLSSEEVLSETKDLFSQWPNLSSEEKQKLVENITDRIIIGKDEIEITLAYLPSSLKDPCTELHNFKDSACLQMLIQFE